MKTAKKSLENTWKSIHKGNPDQARNYLMATCSLCNIQGETSLNNELVKAEAAILALEIQKFGTEEEKEMFRLALMETQAITA